MDRVQRITRCIDKGLELIGSTVKEVVYFHFESTTGIRKEEVPYRIDKFISFLESIFGPASSTIEELILKEIAKEFEIDATNLDEAIRKILSS